MLNELYNKIKEQSRFDDVFKPLPKEEVEKRRKERWKKTGNDGIVKNNIFLRRVYYD